MQIDIQIDFPISKIKELISKMSLNELEEIKNAIIEKELYFKKFEKDDIKNIIEDFKQEGYSSEFLNDLKNGLKKSSVYNEN